MKILFVFVILLWSSLGFAAETHVYSFIKKNDTDGNSRAITIGSSVEEINPANIKRGNISLGLANIRGEFKAIMPVYRPDGSLRHLADLTPTKYEQEVLSLEIRSYVNSHFEYGLDLFIPISLAENDSEIFGREFQVSQMALQGSVFAGWNVYQLNYSDKDIFVLGLDGGVMVTDSRFFNHGYAQPFLSPRLGFMVIEDLLVNLSYRKIISGSEFMEMPSIQLRYYL